MEQVTITRHNHGASGEYHAQIEGSPHIGRLIWREVRGARDASSTQVPKEIGGRGIAGKLVEALMADARAEGFKVIPSCSYVEAAIKRHPEWADLRA